MQVPILTYHAVAETAHRTPLAVWPGQFRAQMAALAEGGWRAVSLAALAAALREGRLDTLPKPAIVITFDDGYRNVLELAAPILREYGFAATVFLIAGPLAATGWQPPWPLLTWDEAGQLAEAGFELGAHTVTHPVLPHLPPAEAEREMAESKHEIANRTGREVAAFAYPYGARSTAVEAAARRHFACACGTRLALAGQGSNLFDLERVDAYYLNPAGMAARLTAPGTQTYLAARRAMRWVRRLARPDWAS